MKKSIIIMIALIMSLSLSSCGDTSKVDDLIDKQNSAQNFDIPEVNSDASQTDASKNNSAASQSKTTKTGAKSAYSGNYDVDLTVLDTTMIYAQVSEMVNDPDNYNGKVVRVSGPFDYYVAENTGKAYYAVLISDVTACCAMGIEFVLKGDFTYPDDYPTPGTNIVVTGICDIYEEDGGVYCQLLDAEYELA